MPRIKLPARFWEGRFKCQALLDEQAILSCMAYVDLNPVRAAMAKTREESSHTSIRQRITHWKEAAGNSPEQGDIEKPGQSSQPENLHPFVGDQRQPMPKGIAFNLLDYLQLVDWTGRQIREDKVGVIDPAAEPILNCLSISPEHWVYLCTHFESRFKGLVGSAHSLKQACQKFNRQRRPNLAASKALFC